MPKRAQTPPGQHSLDLSDLIGECYDDPLKFVLLAFPWGQAGTPLAKHDGPDDWQVIFLQTLGRQVRKAVTQKEEMAAIRMAVASGHGVGKSALVAWGILWFISTRVAPQIVVTANTKTQLETKTWRELSKWHKLAINADWFAWTATKFYLKGRPEDWFAACIPWTKERAEAFAGTHAEHVLVVYDEASAIDDTIWEVTEGAMTTHGAMWICFGNPTKNTGRFRECWRKFRSRWITMRVDSRKAKMANKRQIEEWRQDWGEDSDFFKVRVRGAFPNQSWNQFIPMETVERACRRLPIPEDYETMPVIMGVDCARFGDDKSVILIRQGPKIHRITKYMQIDAPELVQRIAEQIGWCQEMFGGPPDACFIDVGNIGGAVVDYLKRDGHDVEEVNFGWAALDDRLYANLRAEMWGRTREWLRVSGALPNGDDSDPELIDDLTAPEYGFTPKQQIQLESKDDMRARGLPSPDVGDALAVTFARTGIQRKSADGLFDRIQQKLRGIRSGHGAGSWMSRC